MMDPVDKTPFTRSGKQHGAVWEIFMNDSSTIRSSFSNSFIPGVQPDGWFDVLEITLEYLTNSSNHVDLMEMWNLETLTIVVRSYDEYLAFFKKVAGLMGEQCDMAAATCDLRIKLSPVFRVSFYLTEKDLAMKRPFEHCFIKFRNRFYKDVHSFRCKG